MNKSLWNKRNAHTLMEMLLVVFIMAMLASMIIPRYDTSRKQSAVNATKANLEILRTAIAIFYESEKQWPTGNLSNLVDGACPSGTRYLGAIPKESITNKNNVLNIPDYLGGWHYDAIMHLLHPNLLGNDVNGQSYNTY